MGAAHDPNAPQLDTARLTIPSRLEELAQVHALIEGLGRKYAWDEQFLADLLLAVMEAGTNAIQHGNVFAKDKSVTIHVTVNKREVQVQVEDFGDGFDPSKVKPPPDPREELSQSGWGLHLMRSTVDEVKVDTRPDHGTTIRLRKSIA